MVVLDILPVICPLKGRGAPAESRGRRTVRDNKSSSNNQVLMLQAEVDPGPESTEPEPEAPAEGHGSGVVPDNNCDNVIADAVSQVMATMYGVEAGDDTATLGPTPTTEVLIDCSPVRAVLDTGSPTSIISLDFFLKTAAKKRPSEQTPAEWGRAVRARFQPATVTLRSYGGNELQIVSQVQCRVTRGDREVDTILQVQKAAPMDLLLGTDVLSQLGFALIQTEQRHFDDLLCNSPDTPKNSLPAQETATELNQASSPSGLFLPTPPTSYQKTNSAPVRLIQAV